MARLLITLTILLALIMGASVSASVAYAQECGPPSLLNPCPTVDTSLAPDFIEGTGTVLAPSSDSSDAAGKTDPTSKLSTQYPSPGTPSDASYAGIMHWLMKLFAWLVGIASITLDAAVYYTVVKMGSFIKELSAIGVAWRIVRDIANIALIFGFIAVGISTIIDYDFYGSRTKLLPTLVIAAVALNFSLFASEAVIDTGNLFATQFYTQINGGKPAGEKGVDSESYFRVSNEGISNKLMDQLGLQRIYGAAAESTAVYKPDASYIIAFMGIILFLITAFVMFSLAFILITRFVYLVLLIITSPIGVAGYAVPKLNGVAKDWWDALIKQTITAPILLLGLYVALAVITDIGFLTAFGVSDQGAWLDFVNNANLSAFAGVLLSFLVAMGLLLSVAVLSKKLGAFGADWAMKKAGALTLGGTAWAMRNSVGMLSQSASRRFQKSPLARVPIAGRLIAGGLDRGAKASFDIRGTSALKDFPLGGIDAGKAQKDGYRGAEKAAIKAREDYAKTLELTDAEEAKKKAAEKKTEELKERLEEVQELEVEGKAEKDKKQDRLKILKKAIKNAEKEETEVKGVAQTSYADRLTWGPGKISYRNTKAAENIKKTIKKSKADKDLETLKKVLEEGEKKGSGSGEKEEEKKDEKKP